MASAEDVRVHVGDDHVAEVEIRRPPHNFFDADLLAGLADTYERLDADPSCRAIVLCAVGKHFCAGADFAPARGEPAAASDGSRLYREAVRLFRARTPVVAAVNGAAIGGGLGLACSADFRVAEPGTWFAANFARLGFHHGFGLTVTLPQVVGHQHALDMLASARRVDAAEALTFGLVDRLAAEGQVRASARALAAQIAANAPLAVDSIRETMRGHLADAVERAAAHEGAEQKRLSLTKDCAEGVLASVERRVPVFTGA